MTCEHDNGNICLLAKERGFYVGTRGSWCKLKCRDPQAMLATLGRPNMKKPKNPERLICEACEKDSCLMKRILCRAGRAGYFCPEGKW